MNSQTRIATETNMLDAEEKSLGLQGKLDDYRAEELRECGWIMFSLGSAAADGMARIVEDLSRHLGVPVPGRNKRLVESIRPTPPELAHPASLSAQYGEGELPVHTDFAHLPVPARWLVLGCTDPGGLGTETLLVDFHGIGWSASQIALLRSASFLINNGRQSFYSSILDASRKFLRFDQGCMRPVTSMSVVARDTILDAACATSPLRVRWKLGDVLVVDNWRMLHGRDSASADRTRQLWRAAVA